MKIIRANKYFYIKGGSENSFFATAELIKEMGHQDIPFSMKHDRNLPSDFDRYFVSNLDYESKNFGHQISSALNLFYSFEARRNFERLVRDTKPDLVHLHNIYHQISPSILHVTKKYKLPVVLTMHDCKVVCGSMVMFADGKPCEACKDGRYYQCFLKKCVKDSSVKSLVTTFEMYFHHKLLHIYDLVDIFISPSRFLKNKVEEMGFKGKVVYLPNFIYIRNFDPCFDFKERTICCIGRLSKEKGVLTLINAVKGLDIKLKIIGEGPLKEIIEDKIKNEGIRNIELTGYLSGQNLKDEIQRCMFTVITSECYENNPRSVIESFALGKPVIGSRIGGIPELVRDNETGFTYKAGNSQDLADKIRMLVSQPDLIIEMGKKARGLVESELNPSNHYQSLIKIYEQAINYHK